MHYPLHIARDKIAKTLSFMGIGYKKIGCVGGKLV